MDKSRNAIVAKWGAACSPCAIAKAKCLRSSEARGARCDRCERLQKHCVNQVHKPRKKRQSRPSKTAQLEERLNSLVDFIKANNSGDVPGSLRHAPEVTRAAEETVSAQGREQTLSDSQSQTPSSNYEPSSVIPSFYNQHAPRICVCRAQAGGIPSPLEPDEVLLSVFVDRLMPNYPFVAFTSGITASELASKRPFLLAVIRMVASYRNLPSMRSQNYFIIRHLSEQMLMRSERSLELLQAILLVLGSYHYHCMIHAQMNNLIALAQSLVADLGLNKAPDLQERTKLLASSPEGSRIRTNDERRALCGVWYMTSIISLTFQRIEAPKYSLYIDQCLRELEADNEYETDTVLVHLVRAQQLSERIAQLHGKDLAGNEPPVMARAPVSAYSSILHTELEKFRNSLPPELTSNRLIMLHINTAALRLWEPPKIDAALLEKISNSLASLSLDSASSLDVFYRSSLALKSWFEFWLSIDVTDYFVLPMPASAQLINAVIMLARWSKLSSPTPSPNRPTTTTTAGAIPQGIRYDPGCSTAALAPAPVLRAKDIDPAIPGAVRAIRSHLISQPELRIDVPAILQAMAARFEQAREVSAKQSGGGVWDNDIWELGARQIKGTLLKLERWAELVAAAGAESRGKPETSTVNDGSAGGSGEEPDLSIGLVAEGNWLLAPQDMNICVTEDGWSSGNPWGNDFFDVLSLDQDFFFDGTGDYGTAVLNNLGHSEA
ncbi:hypothetical protein GGR53DRAFT_489111 [Hypoxylon sp. FL1150]|nr:hypothetical protein GGR53DRAFT_489111 [Hypoxylon sp. FL1150]